MPAIHRRMATRSLSTAAGLDRGPRLETTNHEPKEQQCPQQHHGSARASGHPAMDRGHRCRYRRGPRQREGLTIQLRRGRLAAAERGGLLARQRPLAAQPTLYTITRAGLRASGTVGVQPCRVSNANAQHLIACAGVAAGLERCYPDHHVLGERDLRRRERERGAALASARMGSAPGGSNSYTVRTRSVASEGDAGLPVAVEVRARGQGARRLASICRAWARCRDIAGVLTSPRPRPSARSAADRAKQTPRPDTRRASRRAPGATSARALRGSPCPGV